MSDGPRSPAASGAGLRRSRELQQRLHGALRSGAFGVRFRPLIQADSARIGGLEALLHWDEAADASVPLAGLLEQCGLIVAAGDWLLAEAIRLLRALPVADDGTLLLMVRLAAAQVDDPALAARIGELLRNAGLAPRRLALEVAEDLLARDTEITRHALERLRGLDVQVYIGGFGTGASSIGYLPHVPVSGIKVDASFVQSLEDHPSTRHYVRAMTSLAAQMHLDVVAEGVASAGQARLLRDAGALRLQGPLFGEALTLAELGAHALQPVLF